MSLERCKSSRFTLMHSSQVSLGLPLLLPSTVRASTLLTVGVTCLLLTWPNHLNLHSLNLSTILATLRALGAVRYKPS
ncbi:hypothetical protein Hanom_Chr10g00877331 [Helianthus anomalus]